MHTHCVARLDRCPSCCGTEEHGGINVGMSEKMSVFVLANAPIVLFKRMFLFTREC